MEDCGNWECRGIHNRVYRKEGFRDGLLQYLTSCNFQQPSHEVTPGE